MVKAKDFWDCLCNELDYRFFSGVICKDFIPLYDEMSAEFMHYIPAANERIALGMAAGARLVNLKSGILIDHKNIYVLYDWLFNFNKVYKVPVLIITYKEDKAKLKITDFPKLELNSSKDFNKKLKRFVNRIESVSLPGILSIGKGVIE